MSFISLRTHVLIKTNPALGTCLVIIWSWVNIPSHTRLKTYDNTSSRPKTGK